MEYEHLKKIVCAQNIITSWICQVKYNIVLIEAIETFKKLRNLTGKKTADRHLTNLKKFQGITIINPATFIARVKRDGLPE